MQLSSLIGCASFKCAGVKQDSYVIPELDIDPAAVSAVLISEAAPANPADHYYAGGSSLFQQTTVQAFNDAGAPVSSVLDILKLGVYLTTAVKCGKTAYTIKTSSIRECSFILEKELSLFPSVRVLLLMGDVAIKAVNEIAMRRGGKRVIPAVSTYKIRGQEYYWGDIRVFPSYLQAGPSFFIEKVKRKMIGEDIACALELIRKDL